MHAKSLQSHRLCATQWTGAHQAPLSMEFSRQKYWSGFPFPSLGDLPHSGIEPTSPILADGFFTTSTYSNCWKVIKIKEWAREFIITLKSKITCTLSHKCRLFFSPWPVWPLIYHLIALCLSLLICKVRYWNLLLTSWIVVHRSHAVELYCYMKAAVRKRALYCDWFMAGTQ